MRIVTFNLKNGRSSGTREVDLHALATTVRALAPDVLALQEVDRGQQRSHRADLTAVAAEAMGAIQYRFAAALYGRPGGHWRSSADPDAPDGPAFGIALLSRYPSRSWAELMLPRIPGQLSVGPLDRGLTLGEEPRPVLVAELQTPAGLVTVAATHLSFLPCWCRHQLGWLRNQLAGHEPPVLLLGDLNMPQPIPQRVTGYRSLGWHATFPGPRPWRQLDHILLRGSLGRVVASSAPRVGLSDHRPLRVDLELS